jgi:hypothetical protein
VSGPDPIPPRLPGTGSPLTGGTLVGGSSLRRPPYIKCERPVPAGPLFGGPGGTTCPGAPGIFLPSSENGSPSPPGIQFSSPPGIRSPPDSFGPSSPPHRTPSHRTPSHQTTSHQTTGPAIDNAIHRRARRLSLTSQARRLSPACRKTRLPSTRSFYGRVNNFEDFSGLRGPAYLSVAVRLMRTADRPPRNTPIRNPGSDEFPVF